MLRGHRAHRGLSKFREDIFNNFIPGDKWAFFWIRYNFFCHFRASSRQTWVKNLRFYGFWSHFLSIFSLFWVKNIELLTKEGPKALFHIPNICRHQKMSTLYHISMLILHYSCDNCDFLVYLAHLSWKSRVWGWVWPKFYFQPKCFFKVCF